MEKTTDKKSKPLVERFDALVRSHLQPRADDEETVEGYEETIVAPPPATRPRVRQLGSKHGATLLMDVTGATDGDVSQSSTSVFNSPVSTSTQKSDSRQSRGKSTAKLVDDKSSEEIEIDMYSRYLSLL